MRTRFIFLMGFLGAAALSAAVGSGAPAAADGTRVLALASENYLTLSVGKFVPGRGWISSDTFYEAPLQGTVYTLYGLSGKLGDVVTRNAQKIPADGAPWDWSVPISSWDESGQSQGLAVLGSWPEPERVAAVLAPTDPRLVAIAAHFLESRHLKVASPLITQAFQIDLLGDGRPETLLCAHSDAGALKDDAAASIYAVVLLNFTDPGHPVTLPLAAYTAFKPSDRSIDEEERLDGRRPFYRLIAFVDLTGDGRLETVVTQNLGHYPAVQIYAFNGRQIRRVLTSYLIER